MTNCNVALLAFLMAPYWLAAQEWNLKVDRNGIKVYNLKDDTAKINQLKVSTQIEASVNEIVQLVTSIEKQPTWAYGTKTATVLTKKSGNEIFFYKEIRSPAPLSNRDLIAHLNVLEHNDKKAIIKVTALPHYLPEKKGLVRVPFSDETWIITSLGSSKSTVEYFLKIDPGGTVPSVLVNLFATKGPYESFTNLKAILRKNH